MAIQPQVTTGGSRQRVLVLALAGVVLLVLVGVLVRSLLLGGTQAPPAAPPVTAGLTPTPTTVTRLIGPSTSVAGPTAGTTKDPFRPVVGTGGTETTGSTGTTITNGTTTTTTLGSSGGSGTTSASGTTAERKVVLEDVYTGPGPRHVRVSVDGTSHTATTGERFAGDYRVVDIGNTCATFESGTAPFTLCQGEAVLK
jgi:hypothetical protein